MTQGWPAPGIAGLTELIAVRHGQSLSNALFIAANKVGQVEVEGVPDRDSEVPLTAKGQDEAAALGRWVASFDPDEAPELIVSSPYLRARDTAMAAMKALARAGRPVPLRFDDRIRDREIGVLTHLSEAKAAATHPAEIARRDATGLLYYRPPGGEAHTDVALRLRSFLADLAMVADGLRVLLVAHDSVVMMLRYVIEGLIEADLEHIVADGGIRNASATRWRSDGTMLRLVEFNRTAHL